jgi:serine phosphatase RsbU (regulator of sigma subunit)
MHAGDILAIYTDGISEAARDGEEFGEERLVSILRASPGMPARGLMEAVLQSVQSFSPGEQADDLTLIVCICR